MTRVDSPVPLMHHDPDRSWITDPDTDHPKGTHPKICLEFWVLRQKLLFDYLQLLTPRGSDFTDMERSFSSSFSSQIWTLSPYHLGTESARTSEKGIKGIASIVEFVPGSTIF